MGTPTGSAATKRIGPEGGTLKTADGTVEVSIIFSVLPAGLYPLQGDSGDMIRADKIEGKFKLILHKLY